MHGELRDLVFFTVTSLFPKMCREYSKGPGDVCQINKCAFQEERRAIVQTEGKTDSPTSVGAKNKSRLHPQWSF